MKVDNNFPLYRKSASGLSYYKVVSPSEMYEIQIMGTRFLRHHLEASILPERLLLSDMIDLQDGAYVAISEQEYNEFVEDCVKNKTE